jgi:TonB family protein
VSDDKRSRKQAELEQTLAEARERVQQAESRHRESKAELERFEGERPRIEALRNLARGLEALREQEGECPLFGGPISAERYDRLLETYRPEIEAFDRRVPELQQAVAEAEAEWKAVGAEITEAEGRLEKERQRQRKAEREERRRAMAARAKELAASGAEPLRRLPVPWVDRTEEDRRHRRIAALVLLLALLLSILIPGIQLPQPEIPDEPEIPERLAQLVIEREQRPEPPPQEQEVVEEAAEEEIEEEDVAEEEEPEVAEAEPVEEAPEPDTQAQADARQRASQSGLLALSDELEELASASVEGKLGSEASITSEGSEATEVSRDIVTAEASEGSGGIETAQLSRNVGGGGESVGDRETSRVESGLAAGVARAERKAAKEGRRGRTDEEIQIVFDRNKAALYRIYNRALRTNPALQGKVTLKLTIEPSGRVSACEVTSSELDAEELERKIVQRVKLFDFGPKDVPPVTITYPIDFLPA